MALFKCIKGIKIEVCAIIEKNIAKGDDLAFVLIAWLPSRLSGLLLIFYK